MPENKMGQVNVMRGQIKQNAPRRDTLLFPIVDQGSAGGERGLHSQDRSQPTGLHHFARLHEDEMMAIVEPYHANQVRLLPGAPPRLAPELAPWASPGKRASHVQEHG